MKCCPKSISLVVMVVILSLTGACKEEQPTKTAKVGGDSDPRPTIPPPKKKYRRVASQVKAGGVSLASLGFRDNFRPIAERPWCARALNVSQPSIAVDKVFLNNPQRIAPLKTLLAAQSKLAKLLERHKVTEQHAALKQVWQEYLENTERQLAQMGKMAPDQIRLSKAVALAKVGKTKPAKQLFEKLSAERQLKAATYGLQATCLLKPHMWPRQVGWNSWPDEELPRISQLFKARYTLQGPLPTLDKVPTLLAKATDRQSAQAVVDYLGRFVEARYIQETQPVIAWIVLNVMLPFLNERNAKLWEWRGVLAQRLGQHEPAKVDLMRSCFLGSKAACRLAEWVGKDKIIAIAGDNRHYWPLNEEELK